MATATAAVTAFGVISSACNACSARPRWRAASRRLGWTRSTTRLAHLATSVRKPAIGLLLSVAGTAGEAAPTTPATACNAHASLPTPVLTAASAPATTVPASALTTVTGSAVPPHTLAQANNISAPQVGETGTGHLPALLPVATSSEASAALSHAPMEASSAGRGRSGAASLYSIKMCATHPRFILLSARARLCSNQTATRFRRPWFSSPKWARCCAVGPSSPAEHSGRWRSNASRRPGSRAEARARSASSCAPLACLHAALRTCTHSATPGSQTAHLRLPSLALRHRQLRSYTRPCSSNDGHACASRRSPRGAQLGQPLNGCAHVLAAKVRASGIMHPGDGLYTAC